MAESMANVPTSVAQAAPSDYHQAKYSAFKSRMMGMSGTLGKAPFASDFPEEPVPRLPALHEIAFPSPRPMPPVGGRNEGPLPTAPDCCDKKQAYEWGRVAKNIKIKV
eukprot:GEMP01148312.1.p2 GENE.GEMP01148312.1~~GEMP01148312.1.p2  ORF type:complete len:119 (+),score=17.28 GEMP01148312.1:36-359(+)